MEMLTADNDEDLSVCLCFRQDGNAQENISFVIHVHRKGELSEILYNFNVSGKLNLFY